jgi:hypothetical protein
MNSNRNRKRWQTKEKKGFEKNIQTDPDFKKLTRKGIPPE